jgi:3-deoxy-D-manno-octulosonic-acid transferase
MPARTSRVYLRTLQLTYDALYVAMLLVGSPVVLLMLLVSRRWRAGLLQRFGFCPEREGRGPAVWIHGVSVGEVLAAQELVKMLEREAPGLEVVVSTTTWAAQEAARRAYPGCLVFYYPLDFSFATHRVVRRIRPTVVLLMELEIWPNFLLTTSLRGVPVLLANGRMSAKSERDYLWLQRIIPEPMDRIAYYCVQTEEYARRFRNVGVPEDRVTVTGNMKFDNVVDEVSERQHAAYARRLGLAPGAFVLMAGSTHAGEEEIVLDAYREIRRRDPSARLVLVPRFPERFDEVEALLVASGLFCQRLSRLPDTGPPAGSPPDAVVLGDTVGELARLYVVADLVFVGGSVTRKGGHSMIEPAGLGKPVVIGPGDRNFRDPVELLRSQGGLLQVRSGDDVRRELVALHGDAARRRELGERARDVCRESKGATRRILAILREHVPSHT